MKEEDEWDSPFAWMREEDFTPEQLAEAKERARKSAVALDAILATDNSTAAPWTNIHLQQGALKEIGRKYHIKPMEADYYE